jgi:hypothetical protein
MTTPRPLARTRRAAIGITLASAGILSLAGCDPRALLYFLQPYEPTIPPESTGSFDLKGKRVVILTHAVSTARADFPAVDHEIVRELVKIMHEKVKKIDIVEPQKVWDWADAHPSWSDPSEAAKAFEADMVIFLEVEEFRISDPSSPGLFKGMAKTHIQVTELKYPTNSKGKELTDKPKEPEVVYDNIASSEFPRRGPMPMEAGVSRSGFKNKFLKLVATEVSWHFVEHAHGDDIQDTKIYD